MAPLQSKCWNRKILVIPATTQNFAQPLYTVMRHDSCPLKNLKVWRIFIVICCLNMKTNLWHIQGVPKKMVHSDFFTPWTVYEHATTREQLRTCFVGNFLSCAPTDANFLLIKNSFQEFWNIFFPFKADLVSVVQHHAPFKCLGDLKPGSQFYNVCTQATITLVTALCPFQIAQEPCSARNLHPRPLHPPCRGQEGGRGDSWCRTTSGSFLRI